MYAIGKKWAVWDRGLTYNNKEMSKYSEYYYAFTSTVAHLREINQVLILVKNAKIKREEPVPDYVGNKKNNINLANSMIEIAK